MSNQSRHRDQSGRHKFSRRSLPDPPGTLIANPHPGRRLVAAAIQGLGPSDHRSHAELRIAHGYTDPYTSRPGDIEGFLDSDGLFLTRAEAVRVAVDAGQIDASWLHASRPLLSSDIDRW